MKKKWPIMGSIKTMGRTLSLLWYASKLNLLLLFSLNLLSGVLMPVSLLIWKNFIDSLTSSIESNKITLAIFWLCIHGGIQIFEDLINMACMYLKDMQSDYVNKYIISKVLDRIDKMEMVQFDDVATYDKISKINNEALARSISINENIISLLKNSITLGGTVGILLSYNYLIVIVVLITYIPVFVVNTSMSAKFHNIYNSRIEKLRLVETLKEVYTKYENIKEIKLYRIENFLKSKILKVYNQYICENKIIRKSKLKYSTLARTIQYFTSYMSKLYIVIDTIKKGQSIGIITMYINSVDILQESTGYILQTISTLYNDNLYIDTLFEFLTSDNEKIIEAKKKIPDSIDRIEFKNIYFKYFGCDDFILQDVNMTIEKGKSYLVVGYNGSGKTTLIKLLTKIYSPTAGEILVNGININQLDTKEYRKKICAVFQDFLRLPLAVEENIQIGNADKINCFEQLVEAAINANAHEFILKLPKKYKTILQRGWNESVELSGGQWQKIALSRAYFSDADIVIMDEPAASLDASAEDMLYRKIIEMINIKTCIMISHRLTTAQIVDMIYVIDKGRVVESGMFDELINNGGVFECLYKLQAQKYSIEEKGERNV